MVGAAPVLLPPATLGSAAATPAALASGRPLSLGAAAAAAGGLIRGGPLPVGGLTQPQGAAIGGRLVGLDLYVLLASSGAGGAGISTRMVPRLLCTAIPQRA